MDVVVPINRKSKRCSSSESDMAPPNKSPRTDDLALRVAQPDDAEVLPGTDGMEVQHQKDEEVSQSPPKRRKSFRRASLARRSLASVPNHYQKETLDKLLESSMKMAIKKLHDKLKSVPNASMESFQKQVDKLTAECASLAESANSEAKSENDSSAARSLNPEVENINKVINVLKAESNSWEVLLDRHKSKAKELQRKVAKGPENIGPIDYASIANSSQYQLIKDRPNYSAVLSRQQPILQTMELIMDTQSKMVRELQSIKEQAHLIVKETSVRLAKAAGFHDLPNDAFLKLTRGPLSAP